MHFRAACLAVVLLSVPALPLTPAVPAAAHPRGSKPPAPPAVLAERDRVLARFATAPVPVAVVSISSQRIFVFDTTGQVVLHTRVSTGRGGISDRPGSAGTPLGAHRIGRVIKGSKGEIVRGAGRTGRPAPRGVRAYMTTRLFALHGLEPHNRSTRARGVFLHGTNKPQELGLPRSGGCIRLSDDDVLTLSRLLPSGSILTVVE